MYLWLYRFLSPQFSLHNAYCFGVFCRECVILLSETTEVCLLPTVLDLACLLLTVLLPEMWSSFSPVIQWRVVETGAQRCCVIRPELTLCGCWVAELQELLPNCREEREGNEIDCKPRRFVWCQSSGNSLSPQGRVQYITRHYAQYKTCKCAVQKMQMKASNLHIE